ncbi:hypothetical protein H0H81_009710 [Sphagnurus paluster]|uniref:DUF7143 domain-containing protein n=1 Tax=Sphagnurus paluster TaxID=117069 RepID=A0A9P7GVP3_9AGAR|nr:hypothetical protein H0H81_009710 [Sphagnurus paluster]
MKFSTSFVVMSLATLGLAAPLNVPRANPCFQTGNVALPAEIQNGVAALAKAVTCNAAKQVRPNVPDVTSGGITFSSIDFANSPGDSPVGFALKNFAIPADPKQADKAKLQNQLNTYLAVETGLRSNPNPGALLNKLKGPKFFLQFQIARINQATGVAVKAGGTVEHQLGKVLKNAPGAKAAELAQVQALAKLV